MNEAFSWLGSIMEKLGCLIPRLQHVESNQVCVMFTRGKVKAVKPGMRLYWPVWSRPLVHSASRQTFSLQVQTLTTMDHKTVCATAQVILKITDPLLALVETSSLEEVVADMALCGVRNVIARTNLADLIDRPRAVDAAISRRVRAELKVFGVEVIRCFLSDFAPAKVICLVRD